jgi:homoserine dehydrogenase
LFYGRGAGEDPTASAVVADLVEAARSLAHELPHRGFLPWGKQGHLLPIVETRTAYYVRFDVTDRPGVVAEIATVLAQHRIGISGTHSPVNPENPDAAFVDMVFLLHSCPFGLLQQALQEIDRLDCVNSEPVVFRIEQI